jgi:hypothetical protein
VGSHTVSSACTPSAGGVQASERVFELEDAGLSSRVPPARPHPTRRAPDGAPIRRGRVQLAEQFDDVPIGVGEAPLLDVVGPDAGTAGDRYAVRGYSDQRRFEVTQAQGEMAGVPGPELLGRPLRAKLLRPPGFGLDHDMDLRSSESEVGAGKG